MRNKLLIIFLFASSASFSQGLDLSSPRATWNTFYYNLNDTNNLHVKNAGKVINSRHIRSRSLREDLVQQLKSYLDASGVAFNSDSISGDNNYVDSVSSKKRYVLNELISIDKIGRSWYLSKATVDKIPKLQVGEGKNDQKVSRLAARAKEQQQEAAELERISRMPIEISTPYEAIKFYLENVKTNPPLAARIISNRDIPHLKDRIEVIQMLDRFFEGKGVIIDLDKVPDDPEYTDSTKTGKHTFEISYRFADLYLERTSGKWYLSKESAEKVPDLYETAFPFGSDRLLKYLPTGGRKEFMGLAAWQYVAILLIVFLTFLIFKFLNWLISFLVTKVLFRFGYKDIAKKYVSPVVRPIGLLVAFMLAETATPLLQLPLKVTAFISVSVSMLIPLFATIAVYNAMDIVGLYLRKLADKTESTFDDQLVPLIRKVLKTFVVIIGGVYVLSNLDVDMKVLFGTLSVGGLALALAAQDTIKNFFGSLMIFVDKPFQAGHWITSSDGIDGTVEQVGFRSTRIRTFANSVISVPNGKLSDAAIDNHGLRAYRRFKTNIAVTYDTPPDVLELFIEGLREIVKQHPNTRKDMYHVYMNDMGSHSLDILFYIFFITPSWAEELKFRHEVILSIMRLAQNLGINFAFPTQTLHMETFPGQMSLSPTYEQVDKLEPKMKKFFGGQKEPGEGQNKTDNT
jgi:MscS family membrane protein